MLPISEDNYTKVNHEYERDQILYGLNDPRTDKALAKLDVVMCVNSYYWDVIIGSPGGKYDWPLDTCDQSMTRHISEHVFDTTNTTIFKSLTLAYLKARGVL
jgi:hypothetical protein